MATSLGALDEGQHQDAAVAASKPDDEPQHGSIPNNVTLEDNHSIIKPTRTQEDDNLHQTPISSYKHDTSSSLRKVLTDDVDLIHDIMNQRSLTEDEYEGLDFGLNLNMSGTSSMNGDDMGDNDINLQNMSGLDYGDMDHPPSSPAKKPQEAENQSPKTPPKQINDQETHSATPQKAPASRCHNSSARKRNDRTPSKHRKNSSNGSTSTASTALSSYSVPKLTLPHQIAAMERKKQQLAAARAHNYHSTSYNGDNASTAGGPQHSRSQSHVYPQQQYPTHGRPQSHIHNVRPSSSSNFPPASSGYYSNAPISSSIGNVNVSPSKDQPDIGSPMSHSTRASKSTATRSSHTHVSSNHSRKRSVDVRSPDHHCYSSSLPPEVLSVKKTKSNDGTPTKPEVTVSRNHVSKRNSSSSAPFNPYNSSNYMRPHYSVNEAEPVKKDAHAQSAALHRRHCSSASTASSLSMGGLSSLSSFDSYNGASNHHNHNNKRSLHNANVKAANAAADAILNQQDGIRRTDSHSSCGTTYSKFDLLSMEDASEPSKPKAGTVNSSNQDDLLRSASFETSPLNLVDTHLVNKEPLKSERAHSNSTKSSSSTTAHKNEGKVKKLDPGMTPISKNTSRPRSKDNYRPPEGTCANPFEDENETFRIRSNDTPRVAFNFKDEQNEIKYKNRNLKDRISTIVVNNTSHITPRHTSSRHMDRDDAASTTTPTSFSELDAINMSSKKPETQSERKFRETSFTPLPVETSRSNDHSRSDYNQDNKDMEMTIQPNLSWNIMDTSPLGDMDNTDLWSVRKSNSRDSWHQGNTPSTEDVAVLALSTLSPNSEVTGGLMMKSPATVNFANVFDSTTPTPTGGRTPHGQFHPTSEHLPINTDDERENRHQSRRGGGYAVKHGRSDHGRSDHGRSEHGRGEHHPPNAVAQNTRHRTESNSHHSHHYSDPQSAHIHHIFVTNKGRTPIKPSSSSSHRGNAHQSHNSHNGHNNDSSSVNAQLASRLPPTPMGSWGGEGGSNNYGSNKSGRYMPNTVSASYDSRDDCNTVGSSRNNGGYASSYPPRGEMIRPGTARSNGDRVFNLRGPAPTTASSSSSRHQTHPHTHGPPPPPPPPSHAPHHGHPPPQPYEHHGPPTHTLSYPNPSQHAPDPYAAHPASSRSAWSNSRGANYHHSHHPHHVGSMHGGPPPPHVNGPPHPPPPHKYPPHHSHHQSSHPQHHVHHSSSNSSRHSVTSVSASNAASSRRKCEPLKGPIPSKFQGDIIKYKDAPVPEFTNLVNFPANVASKMSAMAGEGLKVCVMCGSACPCSSNNTKSKSNSRGGRDDCSTVSASNKHKTVPNAQKLNGTTSGGGSCFAIIPTQNKGLCTFCDVNVWVVVENNLQIKWCKGCKNFRPWAAFGDKGLATKCVRCRERQREKYALQKEEKEKARIQKSSDLLHQ